MGLLTSMITGLGIGAVSSVFRPDMPDPAPPPDVDIAGETLKAREARRRAADPTLLDSLEQNRRTALSLSRGEIPDEIESTVRRVAAENAVTRGLSADQATRMTARDLGVNQLALMKEGYALSEALQSIENTEWAVAQDSALGRANQMFEAHAMSENARLARWQQESKQHSAFWGGLAQTAGAAVSDVDDDWIGGLLGNEDE